MPGRGLSPSEQGSRDGEPWRAGGGDRGAPESSTVPVVLKRGEGFSIAAARCPATTGPDHQRAWELSSRTSQNQRQNLVTQRSGPRRRQGRIPPREPTVPNVVYNPWCGCSGAPPGRAVDGVTNTYSCRPGGFQSWGSCGVVYIRRVARDVIVFCWKKGLLARLRAANHGVPPMDLDAEIVEPQDDVGGL